MKDYPGMSAQSPLSPKLPTGGISVTDINAVQEVRQNMATIRKGTKSGLGSTGGKPSKLENQLKVTHAYLPQRMKNKVDKFIGKIDNDASKQVFIAQNRYNECPTPTRITKPTAKQVSESRILSGSPSPDKSMDGEDGLQSPRLSKGGLSKEKKESI